MKLRNKKTGEITNLSKIYDKYSKFEELLEEWEDYDEPKKFWYIYGNYVLDDDINSSIATRMIPIGNYFETKEEAERAVEKLKAWKRLKAKGFRFNSCKIEMSEIIVPEITITAFIDSEEPETLNLVNLLFGGEDE